MTGTSGLHRAPHAAPRGVSTWTRQTVRTRHGTGRVRAVAPIGPGSALLERGLALAVEQRPDLARAVPAVPAQRADRRQLAGLRPASNRLGVNPEQLRHL